MERTMNLHNIVFQLCDCCYVRCLQIMSRLQHLLTQHTEHSIPIISELCQFTSIVLVMPSRCLLSSCLFYLYHKSTRHQSFHNEIIICCIQVTSIGSSTLFSVTQQAFKLFHELTGLISLLSRTPQGIFFQLLELKTSIYFNFALLLKQLYNHMQLTEDTSADYQTLLAKNYLLLLAC